MFQNSLQIEKDLSHSYLYLHEQEWKEENHEQKIIQKCSISGTLPFRLIQEEEENIFQYDFSSYERMMDYFAERKMSLSHIISLFKSIHCTLLRLEEYLLSPEILGLDTALIMYDSENNLFLFPLIPSKSEELNKEIRLLIDFVAEHLDETDEKAILSSFFLQQEKKRDPLQIKRILQILHMQEEKRRSVNTAREQAFSDGRECPDYSESGESLNNSCFKSNDDSFLKQKEKQEGTKGSATLSDSVKEWDLSSCTYDDYMKSMKNPSDNPDSKIGKEFSSTDFSLTSQENPPKSEKSSFLFSLHKLFLKKGNKEKEGNSGRTAKEKEEGGKSSELIAHEKKKAKKKALKKFFLCLFLMLLLPIVLYFWKGLSLLQEYLPFLLLIEAAALLYGSLDLLSGLFSRNFSEQKRDLL